MAIILRFGSGVGVWLFLKAIEAWGNTEPEKGLSRGGTVYE